MLNSSIIMLFGFLFMSLNSQKNNDYAQGNRYVSCITSKYGIQGPQDLSTDRERSLYQTILWMNDRCATMVKLGYEHGHMLMVFGIVFLSLALLNGVIWWKLRAFKT